MAGAAMAFSLLQRNNLNPSLCLYWSLNWEGKGKERKEKTIYLSTSFSIGRSLRFGGFILEPRRGVFLFRFHSNHFCFAIHRHSSAEFFYIIPFALTLVHVTIDQNMQRTMTQCHNPL